MCIRDSPGPACRTRAKSRQLPSGTAYLASPPARFRPRPAPGAPPVRTHRPRQAQISLKGPPGSPAAPLWSPSTEAAAHSTDAVGTLPDARPCRCSSACPPSVRPLPPFRRGPPPHAHRPPQVRRRLRRRRVTARWQLALGTDWNDRISSYKTFNNCQVRHWEHTDFSGADTGYQVGDQDWIGDLNDRASAIDFTYGPSC